jgi:hypothetical protein
MEQIGNKTSLPTPPKAKIQAENLSKIQQTTWRRFQIAPAPKNSKRNV